jgi:hypothetical protein
LTDFVPVLLLVLPVPDCCLSPVTACLTPQVGLFELDPSQLPAGWQVQPQLLPPLGASPDAVLVHKLTLLPEDMQAAAALLSRANANSSSSTSGGGGSGSSSGSGSRLGANGTAAGAGGSGVSAEAAEAAAVQYLLQQGFSRLRCAGPRPAATGVQYADSSDEEQQQIEQEAGSDASSSSSSSSSEAEAAEHCSSSSSIDSAGVGSNASSSTTDATAAGSIAGHGGNTVSCDADSSALQIEQAGSLDFEPVAVTVLRVLREWQQQQQQGEQQTQQQTQQQQQQQQSHNQSANSITLVVREAVEVKNHSPFGVR